MDSNLAYQEERQEELINGQCVMMAPTSINHVFVAGNIFHLFKNYLRGKSCVPLMDGALVFLTEKDHFVPDMMVVCDRSKIQLDGVHGAPDLVVEILSPSTAKNDRTHKKEVYAACGVREYWIVNPADQSIEVYRSSGSEFVFHDIYTVFPGWMLSRMSAEERAAVVTHFKCSLFDDLDLSLEDIFSGLLP